MRYGYAREGVSTREQDCAEKFKNECVRLQELGIETLVYDRFADSERERPNLMSLVGKDIKVGDIIYVTRMSVFEDSLIRIMSTVKMILDKGVSIYLDGVGEINSEPESGPYKMLVKLSEEEREMGIERNYEGKAVARKKESFSEGRPRIPADIMDKAIDLLKSGRKINDVVYLTGISVSSLTRELKRREGK